MVSVIQAFGWISNFALSARIHNDFLLCNGLRKHLIRIISRDLQRFIVLQRFAERANSHYQQGFIAIHCFADLFVYVLEATCNSRGARAFVLVQNIFTNVPRVLLRACRRNVRCRGRGVKMLNFSEAPASIALMWLCGAPAGDQTKTQMFTPKLPIAPAWGSYSYII